MLGKGKARQEEFEKYVGNNGLHIQAAFYFDIVKEILGHEPARFSWIVVEREPPHMCAIYNAESWLDLRCRGDGFLMWSHQDDIRVLNMFPPLPDGESASCQLEGAVETGNIQFGFAEAASHGAQWVIQWLRGSQVPLGRTYTIHMGDLPLPEITVTGGSGNVYRIKPRSQEEEEE